MKKKTYRIILLLLVITLALSGTLLYASATEVLPELPTDEQTEELPEASTEPSVELSSDGVITGEDVKAFFGNIGSTIIKHKATILSALASLLSSLGIIVMQKLVRPSVRKVEESAKDWGEKTARWQKDFAAEVHEKITAIASIVHENCEKTNALIASYEKERSDAHAADAFAKICHQQSEMLHRILMQSSLAPSIKEEADRVYATSEHEIAAIMNGGDSDVG